MAVDTTAIKPYLNKINSAVYGEEVRSSIHDAIVQCYSDMEKGKIIQVSKYANMTDKNCVYLYIGSETEYEEYYGDWFYYDTTEKKFVSGGSMGGSSELTIEGTLYSLVYGANF